MNSEALKYKLPPYLRVFTSKGSAEPGMVSGPMFVIPTSWEAEAEGFQVQDQSGQLLDLKQGLPEYSLNGLYQNHMKGPVSEIKHIK